MYVCVYICIYIHTNIHTYRELTVMNTARHIRPAGGARALRSLAGGPREPVRPFSSDVKTLNRWTGRTVQYSIV